MRKSFGFLISTPSLTEGTSDFLLEVTPRREQTYFILLLQRGSQESSQRIRTRCSLDLVPVGHSLLSAPPSAPGLSPWVCGGGGEDNNPFKGQEGAPIPGYLACPAPEAVLRVGDGLRHSPLLCPPHPCSWGQAGACIWDTADSCPPGLAPEKSELQTLSCLLLQRPKITGTKDGPVTPLGGDAQGHPGGGQPAVPSCSECLGGEGTETRQAEPETVSAVSQQASPPALTFGPGVRRPGSLDPPAASLRL